MAGSRREFLGKMLSAPLAAVLPSHFCRAADFLAPDEERARLAEDPLRPQFHLLPAKNWMNDPNGPIFWKGKYHMFFQYNPGGAVWGDMHWAHALSPDMIHWKHLPIALSPTPGSADSDGCFTGSAVDDGGRATLIYTGVKSVPAEAAEKRATLRDGHHDYREVQCLATSDEPQLLTWNKSGTPIIEPPSDPLLTGFRDPFLWRDGGVWYLGVGSGLRKQGGRVLLYRSMDLRQWEYLHPLASGKWTEREESNPVDSGEMWECPDFFGLGKKHVLLYSTAGKVIWETGELDRKELLFHSERSGQLDYGAYYAQKTQLDAKGNRILWGWIPERRPESDYRAAGWAGSMALPRVLTLNGENDLEMRVAPAAAALRARDLAKFAGGVRAGMRSRAIRQVEILDLAGELEWEVGARMFLMTLKDRAGPWWGLQVMGSSNGTIIKVNGETAALPPLSGSGMKLHLLLDGSIAEFFCNDLHVFTSRIYRKPDGPLQIEVADQEAEKIEKFKVWQLKPISSDRLTT